MDICTVTKQRKLCTEKKKQSQITFDYPLPILGSELERAWKRGYDMKTRENAIENVFWGRYEKLLPYLSFCYLHALRSPITNARAGGAYLNLFSFPQSCIWFRSVVVITSALHAEGRQFEPGRNHYFHFSFFFFFSGEHEPRSEDQYVFRFMGEGPNWKKILHFLCKVRWLSKLLSNFQFGVVWAMYSLFRAAFIFLSAHESEPLTLPVNKSPVIFIFIRALKNP